MLCQPRRGYSHTILLVTADPQASDDQPRRGPRSPRRRRPTRGRRAVALSALVLSLAGFAISATGLAAQLLPRQFSAAQRQQIVNWEIASRWQELTAGQIFPATIGYQLSAALLQEGASLSATFAISGYNAPSRSRRRSGWPHRRSDVES